MKPGPHEDQSGDSGTRFFNPSVVGEITPRFWQMNKDRSRVSKQGVTTIPRANSTGFESGGIP
jgi:hypothetical protein